MHISSILFCIIHLFYFALFIDAFPSHPISAPPTRLFTANSTAHSTSENVSTAHSPMNSVLFLRNPDMKKELLCGSGRIPESLKSPCFQRIIAILLTVFRQEYHALHMLGVREHIHGLDTFYFVAMVFKYSQVAGKGVRSAGNVHYFFR